ncbi:Cytochrome c-like domain protein [Madurella fahalii]|uniref:Cytochrome c-like domain protein n=1 Tax=Madurella fahalii TaxID=1157608 RepID=A0ABQ0GE33_9PEZI
MAETTAITMGPLDHLDASLDDFAPSIGSPRLPFGYPSAHSGFRSDDTASEASDSGASAGGYSPPAWRRLGNGDRSSGFWRKSDNLMMMYDDVGRSRESSPEYESADEGDEILAQAIRTRLPTGSLSPEKERSPEPEYYPAQQHLIDDAINIKQEDLDDRLALSELKDGILKSKDVADNYIRFAVRAEVQHRTEPIEMAINSVRGGFSAMTRSWISMLTSFMVAVLSYAAIRWLSQPAALRPVPDLVKVAAVARSLEPLIYYSENGLQQVGDLQATGVAVWDLGESVRSSNMTSAPIIVKELDELSDSLKTLAIELTKFFANVDGDIDGILIVMDWARRELSQVQQLPPLPLSSAFDNIHNLLSNAGILEDPVTGQPTRLGSLATSLFGQSTPQRTKQTLQRTFNEFLTVLEDAVASELQHSLALFALFEAIDHQFLNLARTVVREASLQDDRHADLLSSLWTRILGAKASEVAKYERNRLLLQNVREKTVRNKGILVEHNHKLLALKANLEALRRKLVSPLVRSVNSSTLTIEEQIRGLEDVGLYLEGVRTRQKGKLLEMLYGSGSGSGSGNAARVEGSRRLVADVKGGR